MRDNRRAAACLQILLYLHLIFFHTFLFSFSASAEETPAVITVNKEAKKTINTDQQSGDEQEKEIAAGISSAGAMLSQDDRMDAVINGMVNQSTGKVTEELQQWLQQFGTARINIGVDRQLDLSSGDLDFLLPVYNQDQHLFFTQTGVRRNDDRNIMNLGVGYRYFAKNWMWGVNTFYDQQLSQNTHQRVGIGGELGWDYVKLSANSYLRISDWKNSAAYMDEEERVANGYDARVEGYLPAWPQLGMQLIWEQYYGKHVGLFGNDKDQRQHNPYAVTAGLNYTPFPLISFGVNQKAGKGDKHDTRADLNVNWVMGMPFVDQIDMDSVKEHRTLRGGRLDLVNRNNNIVLEYRKKETISLSLPNNIEGEESETLPIAVKVSTKHPLSQIIWHDAGLISHGGKIINTDGAWSIVLPYYEQDGAENNIYVISATAYDVKGNQSDTAYISVAVKGYNILTATTLTTTTSSSLLADGVSSTPVTLTIMSGSGKPISGVESQLSTQLIHPVNAKITTLKRAVSASADGENITPFKEQSPGIYTCAYTSGKTAGTVIIQPKYNNTLLSKATVKLVAVNSLAKFTQLDAVKTTALANGQDVITLQAHIVNAQNEPAEGVAIQWQSSNANALLSATHNVSDAQGNASVSLTSDQVLNTLVSAELENGESVKSPDLQFTADAQTAKVVQLTAEKKIAKANGHDVITLSAVVKDASNHPLAGQSVKWEVSSSSITAQLSQSQTTTDDKGVATVALTSTQAGDVAISASTGTSAAIDSGTLSFVADSDSAVLGAVTADKLSGLADGADVITLKVKVEDAEKNPVPGAKINWATASTTAQLSADFSLSGNDGVAMIDVTSTTVEALQISAKMAQQTQTSAQLSFTADSTTAKVKLLQADSLHATANDDDAITLTASVVDASDHPVAAAPLHWTIVEGQGVLSQSQTTTDAQGESAITLSSADVGKIVVSAASTAGAAVNSPELTFIADTSTAKVSAVTVDKTQALANGKDSVTYQATVVDDEGNPVRAQKVKWTATPTTAKLASLNTLTDTNGVATVTLVTSAAGEVNVTAKAGTGVAGNAPSVMFTADSATAQVSGLSVSQQTALANGLDSVTISGLIADTKGNVVKDVNVAWSVSPVSGLLSTVSGKSDAQGRIAVTLTSTHIANYRVTATVNGTQETSGAISFTADAATAAISSLSADKTVDIIAGTDSVTLSAIVQDANGLPVSGAVVSWAGDNAKGVFSETRSSTDSNGSASVTYSSTLAIPTVITVKTGAVSQKTVNLTFIPDLQTAAISTVTNDKRSAVASGTDLISMLATVKDRYGNPVSQANVSWQVIPTGNTQLSAVSQLTDANGQTGVTLGSTDRGAFKAVATYNSVSKSSLAVLYVSDLATKAVTDITADKTTGVIAGKDVITLKATVKDENDNPVSNAEVYWGSDNDSGTFAPDDTSVTNALGVAEITYSATSAVPTVIGAGVNSEYKTLGVDFTGDASTSLIAAVQADKTKAVADNAEQVTWHAVAKDANGNALPGVTVNWSSANADLKLSGVSSVTDATGTASISGYTAKAGDFLVTATIVATGKSLTAAKVSFVGDVKTAGVSALISDKKTVAANNSDSAKYSVTVKDVNGNLVPDATVVWTTSMNTLSASSSQTDANGSALVNLTGATIGQVTVTATIGSSTRKVDDVVFVNNLEDLWVVNSANSEYDSPEIKGFRSLGFVTDLPTTGPTTLDWQTNGYSDVTTPITLISKSGKQYIVNLKGYRESACTRRPLNAAASCEDVEAGMKAIFTYAQTDNPGLPAGHYMGVIHFSAKDWNSSYTFAYTLTMDLTVN